MKGCYEEKGVGGMDGTLAVQIVWFRQRKASLRRMSWDWFSGMMSCSSQGLWESIYDGEESKAKLLTAGRWPVSAVA